MNPSPTASSTAQPVVLPANQPRQYYRGGSAIAALRGVPPASEFGPEDWVASTTTRFGETAEGLTVLPDGRLLRDAVTADPAAWLGPDHMAAFGPSTALLVKLLDPAQRLPVHCHPSNDFAQQHFGSHFGKTEAWIVIGASGADPRVHIGFREPVDRYTLADWVRDQNHDALLGALNSTTVSPGDTVFIPAGLPHAIGAGVFIVELQQPTDLSVTLEWDGFLDTADAGSLGAGFDVALGCVDRDGWGDGRWESLVRRTARRSDAVVDLFGEASSPFFRADRLQGSGSGSGFGIDLEPSFSVLVALDGEGTLRTEHGGSMTLRKGETVVVPYAAGSSVVDGAVTAIRCRPPAV
ncbi:MAG TPA: class I mannose-6-phosphate isomerase [Pseudonocardiaceae bacterium]|nr:class I mannose-6-phosphate isomerase [Pseudonocardiaceae bacterium]